MMFKIAEEKRRLNIAEYLLFIWQMEDLLRGLDFDMKRLVDEILVSIEDDKELGENIQWFQKMSTSMKSSGLHVSGHLPETYEILNELQLLQHTLITVIGDANFIKYHAAAKPVIEDFRLKAEQIPRGDIETALTAVYGILTLKLANKEISSETKEAVVIITSYLAQLAKSYNAMKSGQLPLNN